MDHVGGVLQGHDVVHLGQLVDEVGLQLHAGGQGVVVDHNAKLGAGGDLLEEVDDALAGGGLIVRGQDQAVLSAAVGGEVRELDGGLGGGLSDARDDGLAAGDVLAAHLDDFLLLLQGHGVVLAGAAGDQQAVHAALDDVVDDLLEGLKVNALILPEGGDNGDIHAFRCLVHGGSSFDRFLSLLFSSSKPGKAAQRLRSATNSISTREPGLRRETWTQALAG